MDNTFYNVGAKLKTVGRVIYVLLVIISVFGFVSSFIAGIVFISNRHLKLLGWGMIVLALLALIVGIILARVIAYFVYAFGELTENSAICAYELRLQRESQDRSSASSQTSSVNGSTASSTNTSSTINQPSPKSRVVFNSSSTNQDAKKIYSELSNYIAASDMYYYAKSHYPENKALISTLLNCARKGSEKEETLKEAKYVLNL